MIPNKTDWKRFKNATKLMTMNYWFRRNGSNCSSCKATLQRLEEEELQEKSEEELQENSEEEMIITKKPMKKATQKTLQKSCHPPTTSAEDTHRNQPPKDCKKTR